MPKSAAQLAVDVTIANTTMVTAVITTVVTLLAIATAATVAAITAAVVVVATVVATVTTALAAGVVVVAVLVAGDEVDGGAARVLVKTSGVVFTPALESNGVGIKLPKRHDVKPGGGGRDEWLVVAVEARDDRRDDVLITHGAAGSSKLVGVEADLGEVVHHGEVSLLKRRHVQLDLHITSTRVRGVHLLQVCPDGTSGVEDDNLLQDVVGEGRHQITQNNQILAKPGGVLPVGRPYTLVVGFQEPIRSLDGAVDVAGGICYAQGRKNLGLPHEVIGDGELGYDGGSRGRRHSRGRWRGKGGRQGQGGHGGGGSSGGRRRVHHAVKRDGLIPCETKEREIGSAHQITVALVMYLY